MALSSPNLILALWLLLSTLGLMTCAIGRAVQLSVARARTRKLKNYIESHPIAVRYARLLRHFANDYLFSAQVAVFLGAACFGIGISGTAFHIVVPCAIQGDTTLAVALFVGILLVAAFSALMFLQAVRMVTFNRPEPVLLLIAASFLSLAWCLAPFNAVLRWFSLTMATTFNFEIPRERQLAVPDEELRDLVDSAEQPVEIEEEEREMIRGVVLMSGTAVREVMTPRQDVISIPLTASIAETVQLFIRERLSRVLVIGESLDQVKGVVHVKDLLGREQRDTTPGALTSLMRPALVIAGSMKVDDALEKMLGSATHFAVVTDEHGGVDGVVTIEDLLEEIVGEIFDEFDSPHEDAPIRTTMSGDIVIEGNLPIDDFNAQCNASIPRGAYDSVAGYVLDRLGRIPNVGEVIECDGLKLRIDAVEQKRVTQIRLLRSRRSLRLAASGRASPESGQATGESKVIGT